MRVQSWATAAVVLVAVAAGPGRATAQPAGEPTVEIRLRSVNDLLDRFEYVGGLVGQEDPARQVRDLVKALSDDKTGIEGVDPKRPFGAYATLTADVVTSPFVVMVPVADRDRFLAMLKERIDVVPEKAEGGLLKTHLPILNEPVFLRFENDYLYVSPHEKALDPKALVAPKAFFAADDGAVLSAVVRVDRIPDDLKKLALGQFELQVNQDRKKGPAGTVVEDKFKNLVFDGILGGAKTLFADAKELSVKVFVDPKSDDLSAEFSLSAKSGSTLAKNFTQLSGRTSLPAGIATANAPVGRAAVKVGLPEDLRKQFAATVDELIAQTVKDAKPNERELVKRVFATLAPTLKAGELDFAATLAGPDAQGRYTAVAALAVKNGKEIEKLAKDLAPFIPGDAVEVSFDVERVGAFTLHKVTVKQFDARAEKLFGTKSVWVATSDDCVVVALDADGATLRKALAARPAPAPVFVTDVSLAKVLPLVNPDLKADELKALLKDAFGDGSPAGKDVIAVTIEGGDRLSLRLKSKGKAVRLGAGLTQLKGN